MKFHFKLKILGILTSSIDFFINLGYNSSTPLDIKNIAGLRFILIGGYLTFNIIYNIKR